MPVLACGDGETGRRGRAFDLRDRDVDAATVAEAIAREPHGVRDDGGIGSGGLARLAIRCPAPGPVHERVGVVRPGRSYPLQAALAAAARARGHRAPQADELREVRERLAALEVPDVSLTEQRRRVADAEDATGLEERVATLRGQLEAARERGDDSGALAEARERAVADLAERRTERLAAEQRLERARGRARDARDRREERLRLEDRERNLERAARRALAGQLRPAFERALAALPGSARAGDAPGSVVEDEVAGALAVCRVAPPVAPVVVAVDRFPSAAAAAAALDAPVVLVAE